MADNITYIQPVRLRLGHNILSSVNLVQSDTAREFHFYFDDEYTIPSDAETRVYVQKPSGLEVYNSCSVENNEIIVQPTAQMVAEAGEAIGQLQIIKNSKVISSFPFRLNIAENIVLNITSSSEYEILDDLITDARKLVPEMKELIATVTTQESQRVTAEKGRVTAENGRVSAEKNRVVAENERQSNAQTVLDKANTATTTADKLIKEVSASLESLKEAAGILSDFGTITNQEIDSLGA